MGERNSWINRALDELARSAPTFCGVAAAPYLVLGVTGVIAGFFSCVVLFAIHGIALPHAIAFTAIDLAVFVLAAMLRQRFGRAPHILLEDVALAAVASAGAAAALGLDVWTALDHVIVALGVFLVFGRLGCLAAGCCHGRPASIGVRYPTGAVADAVVGLRLFPVQLVEAVWTAIITIAAVAVIGGGRALEVWLLGYAAGRFVLEWLRGDAERAWFARLTVAQWFAIAIAITIAAIESTIAWNGGDRAPAIGVAVAVAIVIAGVVARRWWFDAPRAVIDLRSVDDWLILAAELHTEAAAASQRCAGRTRGSAELFVEIDLGDAGTQLVTYTIAGPDREVVAGLLVQRRAHAHVLRAMADADGRFVVCLHDHAPDGPDVAAHPLHVMMRAHAVASTFPIVPVATPVAEMTRSATYLQPWNPS